MAEIRYPDSWAALTIPQWRLELLATLKELADPIYQQKAWIEKAVDDDVIVGAAQVYHSLFDDLDLGTHPQAAIGSFLFDEAEVDALAPLIGLMGAIRDELGEAAADQAYVDHPRWREVVAAAAQARATLSLQGDPHPRIHP